MQRVQRVKFLGLSGLLFVLWGVLPAFAASEPKIAFIDLQKALASTKAGAEAQKKIEIEMKKSQGQIDAKKGEYEKLQAAIEKQKGSLNPKALAEKEEQLLTMKKELERSFQDKREELKREQGRMLNELVMKMRKVVEAYGKEEDFTLIIEKGAGGVLFADSKIDITDVVVKKFDAQN